MNRTEALAKFAADKPRFEELGVILHGVTSYLPDEYRRDYKLAMDAAAGTLTTDPSSGVPAMLTTYIDPAIYEVLFAPNNAAKILGENRKGDWLMDTTMFPVVEHTGEVSSYGDRNNNGRAGANTNFPQRQSYLFQTIMDYGERDLERAGLARINWVQELNGSAATQLAKYLNFTYFFGVKGLQNYGLLNDPNLPAPLTPATKDLGGATWFTPGGAPNATANEVYNDILTLFQALVAANTGLVDQESRLVLALSPALAVAMGFINTFGLVVRNMLKDEFPNLRIERAVQYGTVSASNPQGVAGGNLVQLWAEEISGQDTGYCAFNEKMRSHPIIRQLSSFQQKATSGTWGAIIRMPVAVQQMLGV